MFPKTLDMDFPESPKLIYVWDIIYDRSQEHGTFYRSIEGAAWTIWGWNIKRAKTSVNFHELGDKQTGERVFPRAMVHPYKLNEIRQVIDPLDETELGHQTGKIVQILSDNSTIVGFLDYDTNLVPDIDKLNPRSCVLVPKPTEVAFTLWEGFKCPTMVFESEDWEGVYDEKFLFLSEFFNEDCILFTF